MKRLYALLAVLLGLCLAAGWAPSSAAPATAAAGVVYFEDGSRAAHARVVLLPGGYNTTADGEGVFRVEAPAGNYTLRASAGNATAEASVTLVAGQTTAVVIQITRGGGPAPGSPVFPFLFLGISMVAVALGGFYVNKRMAERGLDVNKSIVGGAPVRKPFRRRKRKRGAT